MQRRTSRRRAGLLVRIGVGLLVAGCVEQPGAARIVGPDGTTMLHVHCGDEQVACFQLAGERCPHGYDLSPIFDPREGNFLVRCREATSHTALAKAATPSVTRPDSTSGAARYDQWPPAEVATPTEPWPVSSSSPAPPAAPTPNGTVDIGY